MILLRYSPKKVSRYRYLNRSAFEELVVLPPSQIRFSICAILIKKALFTHVAAGQLYRRRSRRRAPKAASAKRKYESPLFAMVKPFSSILELVVNYWRAKQKIPGILEIGKFFSINGLLQYTYQPATKSNTFWGCLKVKYIHTF